MKEGTKFALIALACLLVTAAVAVFAPRPESGPRFNWTRVVMDGSRTGVTSVGTDIEAALGVFEDDAYVSPNGTRFTDGIVPEVAAALVEVQPKMSHLKEHIGFCPEEMVAAAPESALSNMLVDALRAEGERVFGVPMDFAVTNFGGIRVPMPKGEVVLDDILSMFPFKNYVAYAKVKGKELRRLFDQFAMTSVQCISGAKLVIKDKALVSAEIGGKPLEDDRVYNVATIDFLLDGGDRIAIGAMADDVQLSDVLIKDFMLRYLRGLTAAGKNIEYAKDGRVIVEE